MKIDLGSKPYGEATASPSIGKKEKHVPYYPSASIEDEDIPTDLLGKDIKCEVTIRLTRAEISKEAGKDTKKRFSIEFRKIDFGNELKDQDVQDDITDAIEGLKESKKDEAAEEAED